MDFIIEASGVSDAVDKATEQRKKNKDKVRKRPYLLCSVSLLIIFNLLRKCVDQMENLFTSLSRM